MKNKMIIRCLVLRFVNLSPHETRCVDVSRGLTCKYRLKPEQPKLLRNWKVDSFCALLSLQLPH